MAAIARGRRHAAETINLINPNPNPNPSPNPNPNPNPNPKVTLTLTKAATPALGTPPRSLAEQYCPRRSVRCEVWWAVLLALHSLR